MTTATNKELFDTTIGYDDEVGITLSENLTAFETEQALALYKLFNELWGVCIVLGKPGAGKDTFGNIISYKLKKYFPYKKIWRDEKPRESYGNYAGIFNDKVLATELIKMKALALNGSVNKNTEASDDKLQSAADEWVSTAGEIMLKDSVLYLTEYWRYCYNRDPMNPMNKTMGGIHKVKRHLDTLILGTVQLESDLDRKTCKPFIDWRVTCNRSAANPTGFAYFIERVVYDKRLDQLIPIERPFPVAFDCGKPRSDIGNGLITIRRSNYEPANKEERKILEAIKADINVYEDLIEEVKLNSNKNINEELVLKTLKILKFTKSKLAIDYFCFFSLFNSKSAPQIKSSLKMEE